MKKIKLLAIMLPYLCASVCVYYKKTTTIINVVPEHTNEYLVYELENDVVVYLPKNDVIIYNDSICCGEFIYASSMIARVVSPYLKSNDLKLTLMDKDYVKKEIYNYSLEVFQLTELEYSYEKFEFNYNFYSEIIIQENLRKGNVKLYDKKNNLFIKTYKFVLERGTFEGEIDYYYLPNDSLFLMLELVCGL